MAAADIQIRDFRQRRRFAEIAVEAAGIVNQATIGAIGRGAQLAQPAGRFAVGGIAVMVEFRQQRRCDDRFQTGAADFRIAVFAGHNLALFRNADAGRVGEGG